MVIDGVHFFLLCEELTKNPEKEIRRLLENCGLEYSDQCMNFHKQKRQVKTASVEQVRRAIEHKETMAWEPYGEFL